MEEEEWGYVGGAEEGDGGGVVVRSTKYMCVLSCIYFLVEIPRWDDNRVFCESTKFCMLFLSVFFTGSSHQISSSHINISAKPPQHFNFTTTTPHHTNTHTTKQRQWTQDNPNPDNTSNHPPPMATITNNHNNHNNAPPHPQHHEPPSPSTQPPQSPTRSSSKARTR